MNRGSSRGPCSQPRALNRFNEAPIHESGKCASDATNGEGRISFNEAPIHESGKYHLLGPRWPSHRGFNEAPIHESGK